MISCSHWGMFEDCRWHYGLMSFDIPACEPIDVIYYDAKYLHG